MAKIILNGEVVEMGGGGTDISFDDTLTTNDEGVTSVANPMRGILTQAEYDALPEDEKSKGTYVISDADGSGGAASGGSSDEVYSEEETVIGTWLGKLLYRKLYTGTLRNSTSTTSYDLFSFDNTMTVVRYEAFATTPSTYSIANVFNNNTAVYIYISTSRSVVKALQSNADYASAPYVVILEYTKTTDTATN